MLPTEIADLLLFPKEYSFNTSPEKKDLLPPHAVRFKNNETHAQKSCWTEEGH